MISIHPSGNESNSQDFGVFSPWLSFIMQQYFGTPDYLGQTITNDRNRGIPVCNDEFGYEGPTDTGDPFYFPNTQDADNVRKDAWAIAMSGGYFTYGCRYTYTGKELVIQLDKLETDGAIYMKYLANFMRNEINYKNMTPDASIVSSNALCLKRADNEYVVYVFEGNSASIDLSETQKNYAIRWYNPKSNTFYEGGIAKGGIVNTIQVPFDHDAVMHLEPTQGALFSINVFLQGAYNSSSLMDSDLSNSDLVR